MLFKKFKTKGLAHYSYLLGDGEYLAVIDPMRDVGMYQHEARKAGMQIKYIFETHRNEDFAIGSRELGEKTGAKIFVSAHEDLDYQYGEKISDGFEIEIGQLRLQALYTPGHTLGHLSYVLYEKDKGAYMVFTGDCLFMGDLGRTDFYGPENLDKMTGLLYDSIFEKLLPLGDQVLLFPAHGAGSACGESMDEREYSTLGYERLTNKHLQVASKAEFIEKFGKMRIKPRYFNAMEKVNLIGKPFVGSDTNINPLSFAKFTSLGDDVLVLDLREKEAFSGGHIPGSIYMSESSITSYLGTIYPVDQKIVFVIDGERDHVEEVYWKCKRIGFDNMLGYLPNALGQWEESGQELQKLKTITTKDFKDISENNDFILLDVRKEEEIKVDDPAKNRVHMPLQRLYEGLTYLEFDKPIYVLCASGERATVATSYLVARNYDARVITGGVTMLDALEKANSKS